MARETALITGASVGIGAELAKLCAAGGYDVILVARNSTRLAGLATYLAENHGITARGLAADLADVHAPEWIYSELRNRPIDILINNAGYGIRGAFCDLSWEEQAQLMQVNITSLTHLARLFLPGMVKRGHGKLLNVASTAAFVPGPFMAMYYASKAFVLSLSESLANEVEGTGVSVTALCPGPTATEFAHRAGVSSAKLFQKHVMSAAEVAREGYAGMMKGKACVIAGARNRWMMRGVKIAPRGMLARTTRKLNLE